MLQSKRFAKIKRVSNETEINLEISLDGKGSSKIKTGLGFLDHMLEQIALHSLCDLRIAAKGDLHIDAHHLAEDIGIALGLAINEALGKKIAIKRFASAFAPLDEALCRTVIDLSGRGYARVNLPFTQERLGEMDTELIPEFFQSTAINGKFALHLDCLAGENNHHIAESGFKSFALALREAISIDPAKNQKAVPSSKGIL